MKVRLLEFRLIIIGLMSIASSSVFAQEKIVHDAEYYVLEAQNGKT
jgi:hypothetical protein